jgi:DNA-binding MarR family transcriptional regulator
MRSKTHTASSSGPRSGSLAVLRHRNDAVRHLTVVARDLQGRMTKGLVGEQGFDSLRSSLGPFLSLIWTQDRPITLLARQLGITKQACSQLANLAEEAGYLERLPDPEDRRSKILRLSPRGRLLIERSVEIVRQADRDYAGIVGPTAYARFTDAIAGLYKAINVPTKNDLAYLEKATRTVGALPLITLKAQQDLMQATAAHGHAGLKMSHSQILSFIGATGVRISDLARIHEVGRQTLSATARDLVALGYVRREPDPNDRRGALLFLTDRGVRLVRDSILELHKLETRVEQILGRRLLGQFLAVAEALHAALHAGDDIFDVSTAARSSALAQSRSKRDEDELTRLAARLHRELGPRRSMQLAALLHELPARAAH